LDAEGQLPTSVKCHVALSSTRAHDMMLEESRRLHDGVSDEHFPINTVRTPETIRERVAEYERLSATVQALMIAGCRWGQSAHEALWRQCVETLAGEPSRLGGSIEWMRLSSYPALLALYAGGLSATASGNYDNLANLLVRGSTWRNGDELPLVVALSTDRVFYDDAAKYLSTDITLWAPVSEHLHAVLRDPLREYTPQQEQYDKHFDRFEFLLTLVYGDETSKRGFGTWLPFGRFSRRVRNARSHGYYNVVEAIRKEADAAGNRWPPLHAGLFDGSIEHFNTVFNSYVPYLERVIAGWI